MAASAAGGAGGGASWAKLAVARPNGSTRPAISAILRDGKFIEGAFLVEGTLSVGPNNVSRMSAQASFVSGLSLLRRGYDSALRHAAAMAKGHSATAARA